ncbi:hypothetical protein FQN50_004427 [Emmonsiellopsis sp. PD_5]|nr:hypothetical protein FQN50_004427 [Emmonsiellopsis sp. PD_5]
MSIRTLHVHRDSHSTVKILDSDKETVLYRLSLHSYGPKPAEVFRPRPNSTGSKPEDGIRVGIIRRNFESKPKSDFDIYMGNYEFADEGIRFRKDRERSIEHPSWKYRSRRTGAGKMIWMDGDDSRLASLIELKTNTMVARMESGLRAWSKVMRFQLYRDMSQEGVDEIVMTGWAVWLAQMMGEGLAGIPIGVKAKAHEYIEKNLVDENVEKKPVWMGANASPPTYTPSG